MIYPSRPIREVDPHTAKYDYYDHEKVVQEDGQIASFSISNHTRDKGWVFKGYEDKYGFSIWSEEDRYRMWDKKITIEQLILESKRESGKACMSPKDCFGLEFQLADDEEIYYYEYGGFMSQRGGYYVVKKSDPYKILRSKQVMMS